MPTNLKLQLELIDDHLQGQWDCCILDMFGVRFFPIYPAKGGISTRSAVYVLKFIDKKGQYAAAYGVALSTLAEMDETVLIRKLVSAARECRALFSKYLEDPAGPENWIVEQLYKAKNHPDTWPRVVDLHGGEMGPPRNIEDVPDLVS